MAGDKSKPDDTYDVAIRENNMLDLIRLTIDKIDSGGAESVAVIERLVDLKIKTDKIDAEKEFNKALAEFQAECPQIQKKSRSKKGATTGGSGFSYMYAELDEVTKTVAPHLHSRGFSYNWDGNTEMLGEKMIRTETCFLRHENGHSIKSTFSAPVTKEVGSMNDVQRHGTVKAYLKRYTLIAVLGISTTDIDTDGVSPETLDKTELKILNAKIKQTGVSISKLLNFIDPDLKKLEDIRRVDFPKAFYALEVKKGQPQKKQSPKTDAKPPAELKNAKLKMQIKDIEERMDKLNIGQEYIDKQKKIIAKPMTAEQAEKLSIILADIQGSGDE